MKLNTTISIIEEKEMAIEILKIIKEEHPEAVIAGGAPRNWEFGMQAKDFDIYLKFPANINALNKIIQKSGDPDDLFQTIQKMRCYEKNELGFIGAVKELSFRKNSIRKTIQIIAMKERYKGLGKISTSSNTFEYIRNTFDFGICKIAIDNQGKVFKDNMFVHDMLYKKLTVDMDLMLSYNDIRSLPRRSRKMKNYFPEHEISII